MDAYTQCLDNIWSGLEVMIIVSYDNVYMRERHSKCVCVCVCDTCTVTDPIICDNV